MHDASSQGCGDQPASSGYRQFGSTSMIKRKPIGTTFTQSSQAPRGVLSILALMMLGSLAIVGLKVTSPNMEATANAFYLTTGKTFGFGSHV